MTDIDRELGPYAGHAPVERRPFRIPGDPGAWVLFLGDMTLFAVLFVLLMRYRRIEPTVFAAAQDSLSRDLGLLNTLTLIVSSVFVVIGLRCLGAARPWHARFWFGAALSCGALFVVVKVFEWHSALIAGNTMTSNMFFTMYFTLTGLHLTHVLVGMVVLLFLIRTADRSALTSRQAAYAETGGCYWHMVDLIWLVLFSLVYLAR